MFVFKECDSPISSSDFERDVALWCFQMAKQTGNFLTLSDGICKFSADGMICMRV